MDKTEVLDAVFEEVERIKQEGNFHSSGEIYKILDDLQQFLLDLKISYGGPMR